MQQEQSEVNKMSELPPKPNKPYGLLYTFERQKLFNFFADQEILDPYFENGKPFPTSEEKSKMYDNFLDRVYAQPDPE